MLIRSEEIYNKAKSIVRCCGTRDTFHRDLAKANNSLPEFVLFDMRTRQATQKENQCLFHNHRRENKVRKENMMKYVLYRSFGSIDRNVRKHELVGVEYGRNIDEVTDALIKDVADALAAMPEYEHCETSAYAPEPIKEFRRVKRYQYEMTGIVYPPYADKNVLIDFGIVEAEG